MSEFESDSYNPVPHGAAPIDGTNVSRWRRARNLLLAIRSNSARMGIVAALRRGISALSGRKNWTALILAGLLVLPIAGIIAGYLARPKSGTAGPGSPTGISADGSAHATAKPAPGKPLYPVMEAPSTAVVPPIPAPAAPRNPTSAVPPQPQANAPMIPATPPQIAGVMPPPPPVVTTSAPYTPMTYPARHEKHFGDSCSGQLTLNSNELVFQCPEDPGAGIQVAINQIDAVDENGIRLTSGKKYHFSIPGMSKNNEQALFAGWLNRVR